MRRNYVAPRVHRLPRACPSGNACRPAPAGTAIVCRRGRHLPDVARTRDVHCPLFAAGRSGREAAATTDDRPNPSTRRTGSPSRASSSPTSPTTAQGPRDGCRVAFNRPRVRNAFRPQTVDELYTALDHARLSSDDPGGSLINNGPRRKDGGWPSARQRPAHRGADGLYVGDEGAKDARRLGRLHILEVQRHIRFAQVW